MYRTAAPQRAGLVLPVGTRQCQPEEQYNGGPQRQQDQIPQLQHLAIALQGFTQKIHRRPFNDAEPPAIEQVNDHRPGGRRQSGDSKRNLEKSGHRSSRKIRWANVTGI